MSKPARAIPLADQPATKQDTDSIEASVTDLAIKFHDFKNEVNERFDSQSEEIGKCQELLIEINRKL